MYIHEMNARKQIEEWSRELGFDSFNVAKAERLDEEASKLRAWLDGGYHAGMKFMENHFEKRVDPRKLVPGARSVIVLTYNYYNPRKQTDPNAPKVAMYAYGKDYHEVIREKLNVLKSRIEDVYGEYVGRGFVDSAPVLERDWAERAGAGWKGKNTLLIHPKRGSYFFLAVLITGLELPPDQPMRDYCGSCTRCIDACPTDAISPEGYLLDSGKCISYLTIEHRGDIPEGFEDKMEGWAFGCDICQDVCPWNKFSVLHSEPEFEPKKELMEMSREEWEHLDVETFRELFKKSAVKRTKFKGLKRNIRYSKKGNNSGSDENQ
jgi:epoxyqueuosine reductase